MFTKIERPTFLREPVLWVMAILAAVNVVLGNLTGDTLDLQEIWESLGFVGAAFALRGRVSPS